MMQLIEANWPLFLIAVVIGLIVAWWIFVAMRRTKVETDRSDVLDEGKGPANRNQALIDAPPAAAHASPAPDPALHPAPTATKAPAEPAPAPLAQTPAATPASSPSTTEPAQDDLGRIKGVGPKLKAMLAEQGITSFEQIAAWTEADIDRVDAELGKFQGRIRRDNWVEQARLLRSDDQSAYEEKFGKL